MYEKERFEEDELLDARGTIGDGGRLYDWEVNRHELEMVDWRGDSESDPLSHTSSSPHSVFTRVLNDECRPMCGRAGGGFAAIQVMSVHPLRNQCY